MDGCGNIILLPALTHLAGLRALEEWRVVKESSDSNNLIEQDHRRIKQRLRPMLGRKSVETAAIVIRRYGIGGEDQEGTIQNRQVAWAPSDASGDPAGHAGRLISLGIDTATATEIVATPNLHQSHWYRGWSAGPFSVPNPSELLTRRYQVNAS